MIIKVKKVEMDWQYHTGREDEREHIKKKLLKVLEECWNMEEVIDAIRS